MTILRQTTVPRNEPLLAYLIGSLGLKRRTSKNLLKFGAVAVNGTTIRQFDHPLVVGDKVSLSEAQSAAAASRLQRARIRVVYEDAALIAVEKPSGLLTVATSDDKTDTLFYRLNEYLRSMRPADGVRARVVHRLDRETSGLVLFAKSIEIQGLLQAAWPEVVKTYLAIVEGRPERERGTITSYLTETSALQVYSNDRPTARSRLAITHYRLLQSHSRLSLVEVGLQTGRKHQIRVHLAGLGCPVAGDRRYGAQSNPCGRLALHANQLALAHPVGGQGLQFHSPLPPALHKLFPTWKGIGLDSRLAAP